MPKRKQTTSTGQDKAKAATPAPTILNLPVNPLAGLGQEARYLLIRRIDQEIEDMERIAQELMDVRASLLGPQTAAAQAQANPAPVVPASQPQKRRGRPPGSKNKPKGEKGEKGEATPIPAQPPTQEEMFKEAVDATRPEMDKEFAQAS
jgi:hypothetical protein